MKTVIVLGNARSGTSMTAGILFYIGVNISHVHKPNSQNPRGAFESVAWNTVTSKIHQEINKGLDKKSIKNAYEKQIKELIEKEKSEIWGWKSAATHWALDMFLPLVENPHLVIVTRNITDNAKSWQIHMQTNYGQTVTWEQALENMADSTRELIKNINSVNCPKLWTTYESLRSQPLVEAQSMAKFLGIEFGKAKKDKVEQFIMPEYSTLKVTTS